VEKDVDPIRDACSQALRTSIAEPTLSALTQCEIQNSGSDRWFVLQFDDPTDNRIDLELGVTMDTILFNPLNALRGVWATASKDGSIDKYIVAFKEPCQTVWELEPSLVDQFIAGQVDAQAVSDAMLITSFSWC